MPGQNIEKQSTQALKLFNMAPTLPTNNSSQQLVENADENSEEIAITRDSSPTNNNNRTISVKQWIVVIILCFVNLINYMDRFTLAGKLLTKAFYLLHLHVDFEYLYLSK